MNTLTSSHGFPVPQANNLSRIGDVALYVNAGLTTAADIGAAFPQNRSKAPENSSRDGLYYLDAAGYLGLVTRERDGRVMSFELTESGKRFVALDSNGREAYLRAIAIATPLMQAYAYAKGKGLFELLVAEGMGEQTARRRVSTAYAWDKALGAPTKGYKNLPTSVRKGDKEPKQKDRPILGVPYEDRGNFAIAELNDYLTVRGYETRSGKTREGNFDLGWQRGSDTVIVNHAETGARGHRDRIRYADGRIAEHRRYLEKAGIRNVHAIILTSDTLEDADLLLNSRYDDEKTLVVNIDDLSALQRRGLV
jgi:hypothetical protein